jgi:UDP-N-acetylmuramoyl-L-alanyl-D-glutamate--2,6-diaminopimelate ligase
MINSNGPSNHVENYSIATLNKLVEHLRSFSIKDLHIDSRQIRKGDAFIALKGFNANGIEFIDAAVEKGALAIVLDNDSDYQLSGKIPDKHVTLIRVDSLSECLASIAAQFYSHPDIPFVVGITGTNGKTTVAHGLAQALNHSGVSAWIAGTLGYGPLDKLVDSQNTTMDIVSNWRLLNAAAKAKVQYLIMEVSSHAIAQGRIVNLPFELAVFTNLSRDHIDYHRTLDAYADTKLSFLIGENTRKVVLNAVDKQGQKWLETSTFSHLSALCSDLSSAVSGWSIGSIKCHPSGLSFTLSNAEAVKLTIESELLGDFNAINLAQIFMSLVSLGVSLDASKLAVEKVQAITGRMQRIKQQGKPLVIVDYAHTPDALEKALLAIKSHQPNRVYCVFGCGGDRDRGKRAIMGAIAAKLADKVIVTSDNPRSESPEAIIEDIVSGIVTNADEASPKLTVIVEREQAIEFAIEKAKSNDVVLIAGKGHEEYQEVAGQRTYFSDQGVAIQALGAAA